MLAKVTLHHFGEGTMFGGRLFSKADAERKAKEFVKKNPGEIVQLINPETGASIKTVH
jgi:hypothetical protein